MCYFFTQNRWNPRDPHTWNSHDKKEFRVSCFLSTRITNLIVLSNCDLQCCDTERNTYPNNNIIITLDELRVSKQTPLQDGLQESQVDHVEQQQAQNGEVHYDGNLKVKGDYWLVWFPSTHVGSKHRKHINQKCQTFTNSSFSDVRICCFSLFYHNWKLNIFVYLLRQNKQFDHVKIKGKYDGYFSCIL